MGKYPEQHSNVIFLEAGSKYFIMALQKEASDHDNLAVAWDYEGQSREVIPGAFLSPYDFPNTVEDKSYLSNQLRLYPNPAADEFYIVTGNKSGQISICTISGKVVYKADIMKNQEIIKLFASSFNNGIYVVRFESEGTMFMQKLVVIGF